MTSHQRARQRMVEEQIRPRGVKDTRVLAALAKVPRHLFVEEALRGHAYHDQALPIGERQTISQPLMVAVMTEALDLHPTDRVLEIGTGSGYQTAILAEIAGSVFTIERIASFARSARERFESLKIYNVLVQTGDGSLGWSEHAPYDAIVVTAGAPRVPRPLLQQLRIGGRLVIPVGDEEAQTLYRVRREEEGFQEDDLGDCRFVKLLGRHGWDK